MTWRRSVVSSSRLAGSFAVARCRTSLARSRSVTSLSIEDVLAALPEPIRDLKVGTVIYSGRDAWVRTERPDIYLLGYNPAGKPGTDSKTLGDQVAGMLEYDRRSNYIHEPWLSGGRLNHMQRKISGLFGSDGLGIDLSLTPASNVVFARSSQVALLPPDIRRTWPALCWSFHKTMIEAMEPKIVLCMGGSAQVFVMDRKKEGDLPYSEVVPISHTAERGVSVDDWVAKAVPVVRSALDRR